MLNTSNERIDDTWIFPIGTHQITPLPASAGAITGGIIGGVLALLVVTSILFVVIRNRNRIRHTVSQAVPSEITVPRVSSTSEPWMTPKMETFEPFAIKPDWNPTEYQVETLVDKVADRPALRSSILSVTEPKIFIGNDTVQAVYGDNEITA